MDIRTISDVSTRTSNLIWVRRSSRPRNWTQVSCMVGRRFTIWATREVQAIKTLSHHELESPELSQVSGENIRTLDSALLSVLTFILRLITRWMQTISGMSSKHNTQRENLSLSVSLSVYLLLSVCLSLSLSLQEHRGKTCKDTARRCVLASQEEKPHQKLSSASTLIWDFQPPEPRENKCLLFRPSAVSYYGCATLSSSSSSSRLMYTLCCN